MTVLIEEVHDIELDGQRPEADSEGTRAAQTMDSSTDVTTELQREVLRLREQLSEIGIEPDIGNDIMQSDEVGGGLGTPYDNMVISQEPQLSDQSLEYETGDKYEGDTRGDVRHGHGKHTCPNGDVYTGQWRLDKRHGKGKMIFSRGLIYEGEWELDKACGQGKCVYENGNVYTGEWKDDHRSGWGKLVLPSGECYEGEWLDDHIEGVGQFVEADGSVFEGTHSKNQRVKGKYTSANKALEYDGEWKGQFMHGQGILHDTGRGLQYSGGWVDDLMEGRGCCRYSDGAVYEGQWVEGLREGEGSLTLADETKYIGKWSRDMKNGIGHCAYASGERYTGEWKDGLRHGKGRSVQNDGNRYEGEWQSDKRHGDGICLYANGDKYEGSWQDGMRHGYGVCLFSDGTVFKGEWEEDAWVQSSAEPAKCKMSGPGISRAIAGNPATLTIEAFDENGNRRLCGGDDFRCSVIGSNGVRVHGKVNDHGDGLYTVEYIATIAGRYQLHCTIGAQEEVEQSPYPVLVLPSLPSLKRCRVSGDGKSKAVVGQPSCFHVESFDEYGNLTSASLTDALPILITMSNGGIECPVTITPMSSQGVYMCEYTVEAPGFYRIEVLSGKSHLPGSPFSLRVSDPSAEPAQSGESSRASVGSGDGSTEKIESPAAGPAATSDAGQALKDFSSHWMTIAASAFGQDGCMDGWDSDSEEIPDDTDKYAKTHPNVPIIENLEDLWQLSKLQRERKQREQKEKAARLEKLQKQLESRFGGANAHGRDISARADSYAEPVVTQSTTVGGGGTVGSQPTEAPPAASMPPPAADPSSSGTKASAPSISDLDW